MPRSPLPSTAPSTDCIYAFTDGAFSKDRDTNVSFGGWGAVLLYKEHSKELSGSKLNTSTGEMELTAIYQAVVALTEKDHGLVVRLYTDSSYAATAIQKARQHYLKAGKHSPKTIALVQSIVNRLPANNFYIYWIKGHSKKTHNDRADALAVAARKELREGHTSKVRK